MEQMNKETQHLIYQYCIDNIEDLELRFDLALRGIGRMRCDLKNIDYNLYMEIYECIEEWLEENYMPVEDTNMEIEDIINEIFI